MGAVVSGGSAPPTPLPAAHDTAYRRRRRRVTTRNRDVSLVGIVVHGGQSIKNSFKTTLSMTEAAGIHSAVGLPPIVLVLFFIQGGSGLRPERDQFT